MLNTSKFTFDRLHKLLNLGLSDCATTQWDSPTNQADRTLNDDLNYFDVLPPIHNRAIWRDLTHPDNDRSIDPTAPAYGIRHTR